MGCCDVSDQVEAFDAIASEISKATSIAICAHVSPDGDALGSALALAQIIASIAPQASVANLLAENTCVPRIYRFLPESDSLVPASSFHDDPDLFIAVDLSVPGRLGDGEEVMRRAARTIVIDHHLSTDRWADVWLVRPEAAAAGVIVAELAWHLGIEVTPEIAQCLFCAVTTDTGRFQYQNADAEAFHVASKLVRAGARPDEVSLNVYQSFKLSTLHLKSIIMGRIVTFESGRIAYSYATAADLERTGASIDECDGLVDIVRSVEGADFALFLKEVPGGQVRGNLRAKGSADVSVVAAQLGGGGHRAAAGFTVEGSVDEALSLALPHLRELCTQDYLS